MGDVRHQIFFKGSGLNSDDFYEGFPIGDGVNRRNVWYPGDNYGRLENALGNEHLKDDDEYSSAFAHGPAISSVKCVGYATDTENNLLYYFILGTIDGDPDMYQNSIVEFDPVLETFTKVLWDEPQLEFDPDKIIKDAYVIDGWIYYNGFDYGLKKVNISLAKNYTKCNLWVTGTNYDSSDLVRIYDGRCYEANKAITPSTTSPEDDTTNWDFYGYCYPVDLDGDLYDVSFSWMNVPPTSRPVATYKSDETRMVNNIRRKLFQFTYRYKYRYHGYSRTAPISAIMLPSDEETAVGEITNEIYHNNYIQIVLDNSDYGTIEFVEIFVRQGNDGTWYYVDKVDVGTGTYDFYNDKVYEETDDATVITLIDDLPKEANAMAYISENVFALGGITEGFDKIIPDVGLTAEVEAVDLTLQTGNKIQEFYWTVFADTEEGGVYYRYYEVYTEDFDAGLVDAADILYIELTRSDPSGTFTSIVALEAAECDTAEHFRDKCIAYINAEQSVFEAGSADVDGAPVNANNFWLKLARPSELVETYPIRVYEPASNSVGKWGGFKTGAHHPFGLVYYDKEMRPTAVIVDNDTEYEGNMTCYVPTIPELGLEDYKYRSKISWAIAHTPPDDAVYYQWFYAGNSSISWFVQYVTEAVADVDDNTYFAIDALQSVSDTYPLSLVDYEFAAGDRLRVLTEEAASGEYGDVVDNPSDVEIIKQDTYDFPVIGTKSYISVYDPSNTTYEAGTLSLIEIYKPKTTPNEIYYAISPIYEIYESGGVKYHRGETQDQTGAQEATGVFERGDVYFIGRAFGMPFTGGGAANDLYLVETMAWSDFYDSDSYDYGKINIVSNIGETYLNDICWSNRFLQDTSINGLATFDADDRISLPNRNGIIKSMYQVGDVLKVYQANKSVSVWVGRTEYVDVGGSKTVTISDKVLGGIRDQIIEYGTVNPESVTKNERYVYGFDIYNGVFWRDSANGLFPISGKVATESGLADYRMSEYFRTKANDLIAAGLSQVKVFSEWDEYTKCLFVTFLNSTGDEYIGTLSDTIAFHEPSNRWISFYDFWKDNGGTYDEYPDCYMRFKNKFYSFLKGELWKHNSTTADRATYYGTKHDAVIDFVVNNEAGLIKLFDAIGIHTNGDWEAEEITIEDSINYPNGMTSKIPSSVFVKREGVLLSEFLRNMKTRSATATALDLYQGEPLRGRTMYVKLINTATTEVYIAKIDINETISKY